MLDEKVEHPLHYKQYPVEAIEIIEWVSDKSNGAEAYLIGSVFKYLLRYKFKNGVEDLKKARWFLDRLIKRLDVQNDK